MDQIIFYKEGQNLKSSIEPIRFSYDRSYTLLFVDQYDQLSNILNEKFDGLMYYFSGEINALEKSRLLYLTLNYPTLNICLCSDPKFALDAWKLRLFHFESGPVNGDAIKQVYVYYVNTQLNEKDEIILKNDGGIVKILFSNLLYLVASGNYTNLVLMVGKTIMQTKQIGTYSSLTESSRYFVRISRSLILNLKLIKSISNGNINFYGTERTLSVSNAIQSKIKQLLLG